MKNLNEELKKSVDMFETILDLYNRGYINQETAQKFIDSETSYLDVVLGGKE